MRRAPCVGLGQRQAAERLVDMGVCGMKLFKPGFDGQLALRRLRRLKRQRRLIGWYRHV